MRIIILILSFCISFSYAQTVNLQWAKQTGGSSADRAQSVCLDASGNLYTTGCFQGTVDFDPGPSVFNLASSGFEDIFISKLDASGNFLWAKKMGGSQSDGGQLIYVDSPGNIYTVGSFTGTADFDPGIGTYTLFASGVYNIFISKLDPSGNFLWAKKIDGNSFSVINSLVTDASGNIYTTGYFENTTDFDPGIGTTNLTSAGNFDIYVSKLDASGNFIWAQQVGGILRDEATSIAIDISSNIYITGSFRGTVDFDPGIGTYTLSSPSGASVFILNLDASGNFIWAKQPGANLAHYITLDNFGNLYLTGNFMGTVDFDPGISTYTLNSIGVSDLFVSKLDPFGNFVWTKQMGGTASYNDGTSIAIDANGNVYLTGFFLGAIDADPGSSIYTLTPFGGYDCLISKLDSFGNFVWAKQVGGPLDDVDWSVALNNSGDIYSCGYFKGVCDFDPGLGVYNLTSAGNTDIFIYKMIQGPLSIDENIKEPDFNLFPNPTNSKINLEFSTEVSLRNIKIVNVLGQILFQNINFIGNKFVFDLSDYSNGIYYLEVQGSTTTSKFKLIKY